MTKNYILARSVYGVSALLFSVAFVGSVILLIFPPAHGDMGDPRTAYGFGAVVFGVVATILVRRWLYWQRAARNRNAEVRHDNAAS
jgi:O-antigen/teichoic acid export membrane protein